MTHGSVVRVRLIAVAAIVSLTLSYNGSVRAAPPSVVPDTRADASLSIEMARLGIDLFTESLGKPGGTTVDARALQKHWKVAPADLQGIFKTKVGYVTSLSGHLIFIGHDGARGTVVVGAWEAGNADQAKAELQKAYRLTPFNSLPEGEVVIDDYFASRDGIEVAMIGIFHDVAGKPQQNCVLFFVLAARARLEMPKGSTH